MFTKSPLRPTPASNPDQLVKIELTGLAISTLEQASRTIIRVCCQGDGRRQDFLLSRRPVAEIQSAIQRVLSQVPAGMYGIHIYPLTVTQDQLWILKAIVTDIETLWARTNQMGAISAAEMGWFQQLTDIRRTFYHSSEISRNFNPYGTS